MARLARAERTRAGRPNALNVAARTAGRPNAVKVAVRTAGRPNAVKVAARTAVQAENQATVQSKAPPRC